MSYIRLLNQIGALLMTSIAVAMTTGAAQAQSYRIAPGVLVDVSQGMVVHSLPEAGVIARDVSTGRTRWTEVSAAKPIARREDSIIAQIDVEAVTSILTLIALDIDTGREVSRESFDLGPQVRVAVDEQLGRFFAIDASGFDVLDTDLVWRYIEQQVPGPDTEVPPPFERFGGFTVDRFARLAAAPGGEALAAGQPPYRNARFLRPVSERLAPGVRVIDVDPNSTSPLGGRSMIWRPGPGGGGLVDEGPSVAGDVAPPPESGGLIVTEGRPGEEFPLTRRLRGDQFAYSVDERFIVASTYIGPPTTKAQFRWDIYERGSFERVANFAAPTSLAAFILVDGRVLYVRQPYETQGPRGMETVPLTLIARDAITGEIAWSEPIRDFRYQGPLPH